MVLIVVDRRYTGESPVCEMETTKT